METIGNAFWVPSLDMGVYILFGLLAVAGADPYALDEIKNNMASFLPYPKDMASFRGLYG